MIELQNGSTFASTPRRSMAKPCRSSCRPVVPQQKPAPTNRRAMITAEPVAIALPPAVLDFFVTATSEEVRDSLPSPTASSTPAATYYRRLLEHGKIALATLNIPETLQANARAKQISFSRRRRTKSSPAPKSLLSFRAVQLARESAVGFLGGAALSSAAIRVPKRNIEALSLRGIADHVWTPVSSNSRAFLFLFRTESRSDR